MVEDKRVTTSKNIDASKNKSKTLKKKNVRREVSNLSNEELLEQIMKRKKEKKKRVVAKQKKVEQSLSNEEILEQIMQKKKKKAKASVSSNKKSEVGDSKEDQELVSDIVDAKVDSIASYLEDEEASCKQTISNDKEIVSDKSSFALDTIVNEVVKQTEGDVSSLKEEIVASNLKNEKVEIKFNFRKYVVVLLIVFVVICCIFASSSFSFSVQEETQYVDEQKNEEERLEQERLENERVLKEAAYNDCLKAPLSSIDTSDEINNYLSELDRFLSLNSLSVQYEDLGLGYSYFYNADKVYYAASTIKSLDALYMYDKALKGEIDLNETMVYSKKYKWGASLYMGNLKYGTAVSLRDLVKYAVMVSDNSAHQMLVSYIGFSNLKSYGKSLGASYTLYGSDNFGSINVNDAVIYMKNLYNVFESGTDLGRELKQYFLDADQNDLRIDSEEVLAAHKYGQYNEFYHDIGVVYDEHPYVVAILTREGRRKDYEGFVKEVNSYIYRLHNMYYDNRVKMCNMQVYGE